jgi:branched-subunit amino acid ABC-type transport system permease component
MGNLPGLKSFSAAVFGGLTSIPGAILGGYLLGIIENLSVQIIGAGYRDIIGFIILVGFLLFRPRGILGKKVNI